MAGLSASVSLSTATAAAGESLPGELRTESVTTYTFPESGAQVRVTWTPETPERTVESAATARASDDLAVAGDTVVTAVIELLDRGEVPPNTPDEDTLYVLDFDDLTQARDSGEPLEVGRPITATFPVDGFGPTDYELEVGVNYATGVDEFGDEEFVVERYPVFDGLLDRVAAVTGLTAAYSRPSNSNSPVVVRTGGNAGVVTGTVTEDRGAGAVPSAGRTVVFAVRARAPKDEGSTWVPLTGPGLSATTDAQGRYELPVPTYWSGKREFRALVLASGSATKVRSEVSSFLDIERTVSTFGNSSDHKSLGFRLDPCLGTNIKWVARWKGAPPSAKKDLATALDMVSEATGYTFTYVGKVDRVPFKRLGPAGADADSRPLPRGARMLIAWAFEREARAALRGVAGRGGTLGYAFGSGGGQMIADQVASIYKSDIGRKFKPGFGMGSTLGELYLHELGHMFGLEHTFGSGQMMDYVTLDRDVYGAGDRRGLELNNVARGCGDNTAALHARRAPVYFEPLP